MLQKEKTKISYPILMIAIAVTALIAGGLVYIWQLNKANQANQMKIAELEKKKDNIQNDANSEKNATFKKEEITGQTSGKNKNIESNSQTNNNAENKTDDSESNSDENEDKPVKSATENWPVYKNHEYKYLIKYPSNWEIKVTDKEFAMVPGKQVKYISFSPKNSDNFLLTIGIKNKNDDDVMLTDRTGVPAGQVVANTLLLGKKYTVKVDIIKDLQADNVIDIVGKETSIDNKHLALVSMSYFGGQNNIDLLNSYEYQVMQKILDTFQFYN